MAVDADRRSHDARIAALSRGNPPTRQQPEASHAIRVRIEEAQGRPSPGRSPNGDPCAPTPPPGDPRGRSARAGTPRRRQRSPRSSDRALRDDPRIQRLAALEREVDRLLARLEPLERRVGRAASRTSRPPVAPRRPAPPSRRPRSGWTSACGPPTRSAPEPRWRRSSARRRWRPADDLRVHRPDRRAGRASPPRARRAEVVAVSMRTRAEAELTAVAPRLRALRAAIAACGPSSSGRYGWRGGPDRARAARGATPDACGGHPPRGDVEDLRTLSWREDQTPFLGLLGPTAADLRDARRPDGDRERFSGYASCTAGSSAGSRPR